MCLPVDLESPHQSLNFDLSLIDIYENQKSKDLLIGENPKVRNGFLAKSFTINKRNASSNVGILWKMASSWIAELEHLLVCHKLAGLSWLFYT